MKNQQPSPQHDFVNLIDAKINQNQPSIVLSQQTCRNNENIYSQCWSLMKKITQRFQNAKCVQNNESLMLCCNEECQENAIICSMRKCQCKVKHKLCFTAQFDGFLQKYHRKILNEKKLVTQTQQFFLHLIDKISEYQESIIANMKGIFFNRQDLWFIQKISNQDFSNINGKQLSKVFANLKTHEQIQAQKHSIEKILQSLNQMKQQTLQFLQQFDLDLKSQHSGVESKDQGIQPIICNNLKLKKLNTTIITSPEQLQTLKEFFPKRIKKVNLLYRASEHDFMISEFYKNCSNVPNTLILIRTEFDKIVGGFTPLCWRQYPSNNIQLEDPECQSFIFSLTEKDKFVHLNSEYATYYLHSSPGPRFGKNGYADLWLCNKANLSNLSYVFGFMQYKNEKYRQDKQSYEKFLGGPTQYFKAKQWEVFKIEFDDQISKKNIVL